MDYEKLYHILFNAMTDAIWSIDEGKPRHARQQLVLAQQTTEEIYRESGEHIRNHVDYLCK